MTKQASLCVRREEKSFSVQRVPCSGVASDWKEKHLPVPSPIIVPLLHQQVRVMSFNTFQSYLVLLVLLGQGRKVAGNRHYNGGGLWWRKEGEEPGDEPLALPHWHDHHTLLITHSGGVWRRRIECVNHVGSTAPYSVTVNTEINMFKHFYHTFVMYLSSHSFSRRELHSCTVLALCCSSRASLSSSGVWTKRFSKSWTSSSKLYIWMRGVSEVGLSMTVWSTWSSRCSVILVLPSPQCKGSVASYSKPACLFSPVDRQTGSLLVGGLMGVLF